MNSPQKYNCDLTIDNPLGFHVRPVQRFAELAQLFESEITVEIDGREVSGKSVMGLMSLGGRHGARMQVCSEGSDSKQALEVMRYLVEEDFFVEDSIEKGQQVKRHLERIVKLANCFDSEIFFEFNGKQVNAKDHNEVYSIELSPLDDVEFEIEGEDAEQAEKVFNKLVSYNFYIEDAVNVD